MLEQSVPRVEMYSALPCFSTFFHWKLCWCAICGHQKRVRHQLKALLGPYDRHIRFFDEAKGWSTYKWHWKWFIEPCCAMMLANKSCVTFKICRLNWSHLNMSTDRSSKRQRKWTKKGPKTHSLASEIYTQCLKFTKNVSLKVNKIEIFSLKSATLKIPQKA